MTALPRLKAITVGSATVDIIATVASDDIERMTLHNSTTSFLLLEPGRKVDASSVITQTGGGAVNAAVSLARLGLDVSALVKLGEDHNAEKIIDRLSQEGIGTNLVRTCRGDGPDEAGGETTAVSVMIASHDRNAAIFTHRGANGFLTEADVAPQAFAGADLVYVTNLSNDSANRFPSIVSHAKAAGAFVAVNPGIRQLTRKTDPFFDSLRHVDLLVCNYEEARALVPALVNRTGWERQSAPLLEGETGPCLEIEGFRLSLADYTRRLMDLGPRYVAVTHGANGSYLADDTGLHHQSAIQTQVLGTVGAGDAFASTLAAALVRGEDSARATLLAAHNAASVVRHVDAQGGLMTLDALKKAAGLSPSQL